MGGGVRTVMIDLMVLHFSALFTQGPSHLLSVYYLFMTRLASTCTTICALLAPPVLRICVCGELIVMGDGFTRKLCCSGLPNLFNKCAYLYSTQCVSIYTVFHDFMCTLQSLM